MRPYRIVAVALAVLLLESNLLAQDARQSAINPALIYRQSISNVSGPKEEDTALVNDIVAGKKSIDSSKVKEILSQNEKSLSLFAKAAHSTSNCDWGLDLNQGPSLELPHLAKMMNLSKLALLQAEELFSEGKSLEGIGWLVVVHRSARHAGAGGILVPTLVQTSIESMAINVAGRHCLKWNEEIRNTYAGELKALPPMHTMQDAIRGETALLDWFDRLFQSSDPGRIQVLDNIFNMSSASNVSENEKQAALKLFHEQFSPEHSHGCIDAARDIFRRASDAYGKPWKESQRELQELSIEAERSNILVRVLYPVLKGQSYIDFQMDTLHTMLAAALRYGPKLDEAAAGRFKDSFDGEPLVLKNVDEGTLVLATAHEYRKGKDIQLRLGKQ